MSRAGSPTAARGAHEPLLRRDPAGQRVHPLQRHPRHDVRRRARRRPAPGRAVRPRPRGEHAHRHLPGDPRQAHARRARRPERPAARVTPRRRGARRRPSTTSSSTICASSGPATRCRPTAWCGAPTDSSSTSRCSPASPTRSRSRLGPRSCPAPSSWPARAPSRPRRSARDAYARKLAAEARQFQLVRSELMDGINLLLRLIQYALFPVSALLLWQQLRTNSVSGACRAPSPASSGWCPRGSCCSRAWRSGSPR